MAAIIEGYDRSSVEYLKAMEDELSQSRISQQLKSDQAATHDVKDPHLMSTLKLITDRLSQVEITLGDVAATSRQAPPPPPD